MIGRLILSAAVCATSLAAMGQTGSVASSGTGDASADAWQKPTACEPQAIALTVVSLKRVAPGTLKLTLSVESSANIPLKLGSPINLVDDAGDSWMARTDGLSPNSFFPGVKTVSQLTFRRDIGGNKATKASLSSRQLVGAVGQAKNFGFCMWTVPEIPIQ